MTANPSASFTDIWKSVVAELNGDLGGTSAHGPATRLVADGAATGADRGFFALLSVPTQFVQNEIERHLREPIIAALSRQSVDCRTLDRQIGQRMTVALQQLLATDNIAQYPGPRYAVIGYQIEVEVQEFSGDDLVAI